MATGNELALVIVPGHGVCRQGCTAPGLAPLDSSWVGIFLGEGRFYIQHAREGIRLAEEDPRALLVFSGGQTRKETGPRSKTESYWEIADAAGWWGFMAVKDRAVKEEYARFAGEPAIQHRALQGADTEMAVEGHGLRLAVHANGGFRGAYPHLGGNAGPCRVRRARVGRRRLLGAGHRDAALPLLTALPSGRSGGRCRILRAVKTRRGVAGASAESKWGLW
jgi:hypothetical protein